jgi:hypothetical protein
MAFMSTSLPSCASNDRRSPHARGSSHQIPRLSNRGFGLRHRRQANGTASYLIDVPNGGAVVIQNNRLEKGPKAENHKAAISIGAEGVDRPTPEIRVEGNHFSADGAYGTVFVVNRTATPAMGLEINRIGSVRPDTRQ